MKIQEIKISEIKPYEKNAKKHDKKQITQVADSIKRFGFVQPLVIDKNNEIVIGHCRYESAKFLKMQQVPCVRVENLSEKEIQALRLADNKLNESAWDIKLVIEELKGLNSELLDLTGFDKDLIIEPNELDDVIPENVPARSKLGDLYELGKHRVLCGDSTQQEAVLRLMDGKKADMVFTDPPYGVDIGGKNRFLNSFQRAGRNLKDIANDMLKGDELFEVLVNAMSNARENMKDTAPFYVCAPQGGELGLMMMMMMMSASLPVRHVLNWVKNTPTFSMGRLDYDYQHEPILYGWKKSHNFYGNGQFKKSVWNFDKPMRNKEHPTMKPVELMVNAILNSSKTHENVLDNFLGSGSTLIASEKTGRICYGMEIDPKYVDVIVQRYVDYTGNTKIIKNGKKIIWEKTDTLQIGK